MSSYLTLPARRREGGAYAVTELPAGLGSAYCHAWRNLGSY